jgi:hypothetical protein
MLFLCFSCSPGRLPSPAGLGMASRADISMVRNMNCAYLLIENDVPICQGWYILDACERESRGLDGRTRVCIRSGYN